MPINDVFAATIGMNVQGQKIVNVLHFEQTSGDGAVPPNKDLCLAIIEDMLPTYRLVCSEDLTFESVRAHRVAPTIGGTHVEAAALAGLVAVDVLASQSSVLATLYTATLNRKGRGRIFMGGVPETFVEDGRIVNADAATYVTFLNTLLGTIQAAAGATFRAGVWSAGDPTFKDFVSHELRSQAVTLRSRRMENP